VFVHGPAVVPLAAGAVEEESKASNHSASAFGSAEAAKDAGDVGDVEMEPVRPGTPYGDCGPDESCCACLLRRVVPDREHSKARRRPGLLSDICKTSKLCTLKLRSTTAVEWRPRSSNTSWGELKPTIR
jgi:hypothetical protein